MEEPKESSLQETLSNVRHAAQTLALDNMDYSAILTEIAADILRESPAILAANAKDLAAMPATNPKYDRLLLTPQRIRSMADAMRNVAAIDPAVSSRKTISITERPNGLTIYKERVPFGVIAIIYEARPNVTTDVFALCLKSRNACLLKGGKEAYNTNLAIVGIIQDALERLAVNKYVCTLLPPDRPVIDKLLAAVNHVDLIIPRGGKDLIDYVRRNSLVPVIETGAGVCHIYFDKDGDIDKGREIVYNAKTRRVSVCNALDCLLISCDRLADLPALCEKLAERNVVIHADADALAALAGHYPATLLQAADADSYGTEFLDYKMSIRTIRAGWEEAVRHIAEFGSRHSEGIISESETTVEAFVRAVDAACVYSNASISFTDGAEFGMGAEIGISTQKLHARGPMGINELLTYKYIIKGNGQTRPE
ncbi:MAG: glutamate-5-semialdehyde dehydrogenase [Tannerellaceae bacterium]|jgi:glutamate-5-semialdehyde dehydrogenase|nr:glutamate-5-semialdehyde dehydrogenase [Tannerellaceae bacterium]